MGGVRQSGNCVSLTMTETVPAAGLAGDERHRKGWGGRGDSDIHLELSEN